MKKILNPIIIITLLFLFPGCKNEILDENISNPLNEEVYNYILDMGFAPEDITEFNDYYLAEGDIAFPKDMKITDNNQDTDCSFKQAYSYNLVTKKTQIKILLITSSFNSNYAPKLSDALNAAINAYNNLNLQISFVRTYLYDADIYIFCNNNINTYAESGLPTSQGLPYGMVYVSQNALDLACGNARDPQYVNVSRLTWLLVHELGHTIGLRHTNWQSDGEPVNPGGTILVPGTTGTDDASVMKSFSFGRTWSGFSGGDYVALKYLYTYVKWQATANLYANYSNNVLLTGDVNKDGKAEIISIQKKPNQFEVLLSSNGNTITNTYIGLSERFDYSWYDFKTADVNGDGYCDIVAFQHNPNRFVAWYGTSNGFQGGVEWLSEPFDYSPSEFHLGDINGDGRADAIAIQKNPSRYVIWFSKGNRFSGGIEWSYENLDYSTYKFYIADVNADSKTDIVALRNTPNRAVVWVSGCDKNTTGEVPIVRLGQGQEWIGQGAFYSTCDFFVTDINADKQADVVAIDKSTLSNAGAKISTWPSVGNDFVYKSAIDIPTMPAALNNLSVMMDDINGTGKSDIICIDKQNGIFQFAVR